MSDWHLDVNGAAYHVTAERLPNGKIAVRVDGRTVAPPQPPDLVDCIFPAGSARFHLFGSEGELQIERVLEDTAVRALPPRAIDPLHLRAGVFFAFGLIVFLIAGAKALSIRSPQTAGLDLDAPIANIFAINAAIRFAFVVEAFVGVAAMAGALMLFARLRFALLFLDVVSWTFVGAAVVTLLVIDGLAHRQLSLIDTPKAAAEWLHHVHMIAFGILVILGLVAGALSSFLDRENMLQKLPTEPAG